MKQITTIRLKKETVDRLKKHLNKMTFDEGINRMLDALSGHE